jgi:hypothetical protein
MNECEYETTGKVTNDNRKITDSKLATNKDAELLQSNMNKTEGQMLTKLFLQELNIL